MTGYDPPPPKPPAGFRTWDEVPTEGEVHEFQDSLPVIGEDNEEVAE